MGSDCANLVDELWKIRPLQSREHSAAPAKKIRSFAEAGCGARTVDAVRIPDDRITPVRDLAYNSTVQKF